MTCAFLGYTCFPSDRRGMCTRCTYLVNPPGTPMPLLTIERTPIQDAARKSPQLVLERTV